MTAPSRHALRLLGLMAIGAVSLQIFFLARVALMTVIDPTSTSFQRSEGWRLLLERRDLSWQHEWVDEDRIASSLKRAVIAAEDASFAEHSGVEWEAIEKAWDRNLRAEARARPTRPPRIVGGSTITQQLAKNLFLSGERHLGRKAQEFVITLMLEALLDKRRILEIYLNNVEWGEGVFGAQAAARHYHRVSAAALGTTQAARLAVMLPAPKRFEKRLGSAYLNGRASVIAARMGDVVLP